ncbi:MAG: hypothetical protein K2P88_15695, partial [Chitinophagaceae bacterium]|nr:hypothetical protein [Chitinophagaceae bacterium]
MKNLLLISVKNRWLLTICCVLLYNIGMSQLNLTGPTTVEKGVSNTYIPSYNGNQYYSYSGTYSYTISGGYITSTGSSTFSGSVSSSVLFNCKQNITITSSSASIQFTCSLGSKTITITGYDAVDGKIVSPSSQNINYNTSPSQLTAPAATGGLSSNYTYQWYSSSDNISFSTISGATGLNCQPSALSASMYYKRLATESISGGSKFSSTAFVNVYPALTVAVSPSSQTISSGSSASQIVSTVSGGSGVYSYQWQQYNGSSWVNVATTANYSPGILTSTTSFRLNVTSNGNTVTSNTAVVTVQSAPVGSLSVTNTTLSGNGSYNTLNCAASGGNGTFSYTWYYSVNGGAYQVLSNTASSYTTPLITVTTSYYVVVTSNGSSSNSNIVSLDIPVAPTVSASSTLLCNGAIATLSATGSSGTIQWFNSGGSLLSTGASYSTGVAGSYYAIASSTYGKSANSNQVSLTVLSTPTAPVLNGSSFVVIGNTNQLTSTSLGGVWTSSLTNILTVNSNGVLTGKNLGSSVITYKMSNACGSDSSQVTIDVVPLSQVEQNLGNPIFDNTSSEIIPLVNGATSIRNYEHDGANSKMHLINNVVSFSVIEETNLFIPGDFSAAAKLKVEYGHTSTDIITIDTTTLQVSYTKNGTQKYSARNYLNLRNAEYVKVTLLALTAPTTVGGVSFDSKQVLRLENLMDVSRCYELGDNKILSLQVLDNPTSLEIDSVKVKWSIPANTNGNGVQLEWMWVDSSLLSSSSSFLESTFKENSTRIDLPISRNDSTYSIPLLYDGGGVLFSRVRAINILRSGSRSDGPWSNIASFSYAGHATSLNWQSTTTFAEEGKRKTVVQYFDGSLRPRQTVTKDNSTNTSVVAETLYDGAGRPAVQILPTPTMQNVIKYYQGLNSFVGQSSIASDLTDFFDYDSTNYYYYTKALSSTSGAGNYYSSSNPLANIGLHKNIPESNGYAYAVTRYMPDGTGRIMRQSGVGDTSRMGAGHETRYYYGSVMQDEIDALFGTEVGAASHYFKNMVRDANGQMSVSYVDMHGRTIATALAGGSPSNLQPLTVNPTGGYSSVRDNSIAFNLLDSNSNVLKGNSIESVSTLLVPALGSYNFNYNSGKTTLSLPKCGGGMLNYPIKYDLEIRIFEETGNDTAYVYKSIGKDSINLNFNIALQPGSYIVRKTLAINEDTLSSYLNNYVAIGNGRCFTYQSIADSIVASDSISSACAVPKIDLTSASCISNLGANFQAYLIKKLAEYGYSDTLSYSASQKEELRKNYVQDYNMCLLLNPYRSDYLGQIREQMLSDMMPFAGQYAYDTANVAISQKYNIFYASGGTPTNRKPYYKYPKNNGSVDFKYYDYKGQVNLKFDSTLLSTLTKEDFAASFEANWSQSLLEYHPEYPKLKYAEDFLKSSFNYHDSLLSIAVGFDPIATDPYFNGIAASGELTTITNYARQTWKNGYSMWQIAYGKALGCSIKNDPSARNTCFTNMPKVYTATNSNINTGSGIVVLTASAQAKAWDQFKLFYTQERLNFLLNHINTNRPLADQAALRGNGFFVHFYNNTQNLFDLEQKGDWFTATNPDALPASLNSEIVSQKDKCSSYIDFWRNTLLQCEQLNTNFTPTQVNQIVQQITDRMLLVCQRGTDNYNTFGSSTVAPAYSSLADSTFERVVDDVFAAWGISPSLKCNSYQIDFPQRYGTNRRVTNTVAMSIDSCNCGEFRDLKLLMKSDVSPYSDTTSLSGINAYLTFKGKDTISLYLYQKLQLCGNYYINSCPNPPNCNVSYSIMLDTAVSIPYFLECGYYKSADTCVSCETLGSLQGAFYAKFQHWPNFKSIDISDEQAAYNDLFAKYIKFKTGLDLTWPELARKANSGGCPIGDTALNVSFGIGAKFPKICLDNTPAAYIGSSFDSVDACGNVKSLALSAASVLFESRYDNLLNGVKSLLQQKALSAIEKFVVTDTLKEYHYTLYYYDQAGNLIKTVPPKGVNPIYRRTFLDSVRSARANNTYLVPIHTLVTRYSYNSLNQVVLQKSPDGGMSEFWYDALGRLVVSQNAKQKATGKIYSYTQYDYLGRIVEVGQLTNTSDLSDLISKDTTQLALWQNAATSKRSQITRTTYDFASPTLSKFIVQQRNLRNRVSYVEVSDTVTLIGGVYIPAVTNATIYTYDVHGNVDTLVQDFGSSAVVSNVMNRANSYNRFKKIAYNYDLVSGKVNMVTYQPNYYDSSLAKWVTPVDQYMHRYKYDAENRLTDVYTGRDSVMLFLFPERDASYTYYKHGPLGRAEMGKLRVQGLDYVYTLQGWVKAVNPVKSGSFTNGTDSSETFPVSQDVFGYSLNYYQNDYKAIGFTPATGSIISKLGSNASSLFNGNIAAMSVNIPVLGGGAKVYNYKYDQLNRIVSMDLFDGLAIGNSGYSLS